TPVTPTPVEPITDPIPVTDPTDVVEVPDPVVIPIEPEVPEVPKHDAKYLWCLDNGHGKFTAGKRSPKFEDGTKFYEYEFNRDIVKKVSEQLTAKGIQFFNVVPEIDTDNFLKGRVDRANAFQSDLPKLFVSIHSNAARAESSKHWAVPGAKGMETWYYTGSTRGRKLASIFQKHMVNYTGMVNRGLKSTKKLYVIKNTKMTAALTENGFYNHQGEAQELMKDEVRQSIADAHVAAIMEIEKDGL
ncbi:MAG: N-acetylmuramoyl-L-alanine amidase, partial [Maribacter sp.]